MSIEIGAVIKGIVQHETYYNTQSGDPPVMKTEKLYVRNVTFEVVGLPPEVQPTPVFTIPVTDATQWDTLQVGQTCTIAITPPPA